MMTSFAVSKSPPVMVVGPSSTVAPPPTFSEKVKLSSWDRSFVGFSVTSILIFKGGGAGAIHKPVAEAIKKGLSEALVHRYYYPVAGRLAVGDDGDGELHIACTGEGVPFVAASAGCTLEDSRLLDVPFASTNVLDDLAVYYNVDDAAPDVADPLLLMQVTEFSCGGFVVGVTWNHVLADGVGMAQFLQAVGDLTGGLAAPAKSILPVRAGDTVPLPLLSPSVVAAKQWLILSRGGTDDLAYLDITIPSAVVSRIKSDFAAAHSSGSGEYCTTFEVIVAVLWQCRTRAIGFVDPDTPAPLAFLVDVRKQIGGAKTSSYYGNCAAAQVVMATSGEVASGDIIDVVKLIKRGKETVPELLRDGGVKGLGDMSEEQMASLFGYNAFMVSSWRNIGFDAADFGGGTPARVVSRWQKSTFPGCMGLLPCGSRSSKDGGGGESVQTQCVREDHADAFLAELHKLTLVSTTTGLTSIQKSAF